MSDVLAPSALGLMFLLGLRHGLDPDHIAVIDNLTFRAAAERPRLAPWTGTLFALGHSLSVAAVAVGVSLVAAQLRLPAWLGPVIDWAVIVLLVVVGALNLRGLVRAGPYTPVGWRQGLVPKPFRGTTSPLAVLAIGAIFGLVFDTATQAAAWGLAAASADGVSGAVVVSAVFAAGMILTDTADSRIVARLLRAGGEPSRVQVYRRAVGWLIVALSFGMAGYALAAKVFNLADLSGRLASAAGLAMVVAVTGALLARRRPGAVHEPS